MYQIVLVDDDRLVTTFLEKMIPWEEYGFEVKAAFSDSMEAYAYLRSNSYDVLMTDIGMPRMNGIELITKIKEENASSCNIIISCHGEFEYAQQALKLKTFDYILKETMNEEDITDMLKKLKSHLDQQKQELFNKNKIRKYLSENHSVLKSTFFKRVIRESTNQSSNWRVEAEEQLGLSFPFDHYAVIHCYIDQHQLVADRFQDETLLKACITNIMEEALAERQEGVHLIYWNRSFFILYPLIERTSLAIIKQSLKELQAKLQTCLKTTMTCTIHPIFEPQGELERMKELIHHQDQRFHYSYGSIEEFQVKTFQKGSVFKSYTTDVEQVKTAILNKDSNKLDNWFAEQFHSDRVHQHSPEALKDWATMLTLDLKVSLNALHHFDRSSSFSVKSDRIQDAENIQDLELLMKDIFHTYMEQVNQIDSASQNEDIAKAKRYIYSNLHMKISLKDISAHLHLNSSYFSRLFKQETGQTFIEYVTTLKMEKAMGLLDNSTKTVEQISYDLAFDSKSYFIRTFKKYVGVSPKAYKYKKDDVCS
ncbi:AraC family transcriptional regulator [Alkalihalobacillus sp. FSL W8-0930]